MTRYQPAPGSIGFNVSYGAQAMLDDRVTARYLARYFPKARKVMAHHPSYSHVWQVLRPSLITLIMPGTTLDPNAVLIGEMAYHGCTIRTLYPGEFIADIYEPVEPWIDDELDVLEYQWLAHVGQPYGKALYLRQWWWGMLGMLFPIDYARVSMQLETRQLVCSSAVDLFCQLAGRDPWPTLTHRIMSPCLLAASEQLKIKAVNWTPGEV